MLFKTLAPQTKTVAIPVQNLHYISLPIAKNKKMTGKGIEIHALLNLLGFYSGPIWHS